MPAHHEVMAAKFTGVYPVRRRFRAELYLPPLDVFTKGAEGDEVFSRRQVKVQAASAAAISSSTNTNASSSVNATNHNTDADGDPSNDMHLHLGEYDTCLEAAYAYDHALVGIQRWLRQTGRRCLPARYTVNRVWSDFCYEDGICSGPPEAFGQPMSSYAETQAVARGSPRVESTAVTAAREAAAAAARGDVETKKTAAGGHDGPAESLAGKKTMQGKKASAVVAQGKTGIKTKGKTMAMPPPNSRPPEKQAIARAQQQQTSWWFASVLSRSL